MSSNVENSNTDELQQFDRIMSLNRLGLRFVGIWPSRAKASRLDVVLRSIHLLVMYLFMISVLIPQWIDMYVLWGNIDALTEVMMSNFFIIYNATKVWNFARSMHIFMDVIENMQSNWIATMSSIGSEKDKTILRDFTGRARDYSTKYGIMMISVGTMYIITPSMNNNDIHHERKYPFFGRYYIDRDSDVIYVLCYLKQVIMATFVAVANYATDSIFLVCMYHFCAELRILQNALSKLGEEDDDDPERLTRLIKRHQAQIRIGQMMQALFSGSSLQQVMFSGLMICISGFKMIVSLRTRGVDSVMHGAYLLLVLLQILFYCQPGDELVVQSQALDGAIYQSAWVNLGVVELRHLVLVMHRSQHPMAITAGKLYVLSLENFTKIVKWSVSSLSVLNALYSKSF